MDGDEEALGLLSALRGNEPSLDATDTSNVDEIQPEALQVKSPEDLPATDDAGDKQPAKGAEKPETSLDDIIEIEGEEGQEPTKVVLKDAIEGYQNWQKFESQQAEIVHRVETQAIERATNYVKAHVERVDEIDRQLEAVLEVIKPPQMPDARLKDPNSPYYNPDEYNLLRDRYDQAIENYKKVQNYAQGIKDYRGKHSANEAAAAETRQLAALSKAWPEWSDPVKGEATQRDVANKMYRHYGLTVADAEKLDKAGYFLALKDALAFREMQSSAPKTKQTIEAKAARIVKSGGQRAPATQRDKANGQFVASDALTRLRKSHSDADATAFFEGHFAKQRPG